MVFIGHFEKINCLVGEKKSCAGANRRHVFAEQGTRFPDTSVLGRRKVQGDRTQVTFNCKRIFPFFALMTFQNLLLLYYSWKVSFSV